MLYDLYYYYQGRFHAFLLFIIYDSAFICSKKITWQVQQDGQEMGRRSLRSPARWVPETVMFPSIDR
jgi:hypothetical protein